MAFHQKIIKSDYMKITRNVSDNIIHIILVAEIERGLESMQRTRDQIREAYSEIDPDVADIIREDENATINISVSFDGTWQKRGFTSRHGIGVCIDILTGLVLDFEVLSSYCHACTLRESARRDGKITQEEFESWKETHVDCAKTFSGSSKAMEQEAAKRMWARSVSQPTQRCCQMGTVQHSGRWLNSTHTLDMK